MHEISLVRNIFRTLEDEFPGEVEKITKISLTAGILSNVQPILMQNAFEAVIEEEERYRKARLEVTVLPVKIACEACETVSEIADYRFVCAACGKPSRNIIQGEELLISKVEFEETVA